ncbi:radical SAM family heme chaperone HemW [Aquimarina brevivitae]|uniref:radical SAM family heme chaperone HemW n=1 Tax=Aquimarina brevivitae TaxID=323412 RepID=UPI00102A9D21|nr:radical SAM family heme chaperone HemW [Aquimarina brevivitae]
MSGIYIHIPFCKQACHYCDFHFTTSLKHKEALIDALLQELMLRKDEAITPIETIYFGGGTPSLLTYAELQKIIDTVYQKYAVVAAPEITLEANPDDLTSAYLKELNASPVNRLSIGIQSFRDQDLRLMNRAHNSEEAHRCLSEARALFENISIDLIYGIPELSSADWNANIGIALSYDIPHISSYALTVEPNTALPKLIQKGIIPPVKDELAQQHFQILIDMLASANFDHYELSNFGKPSYYSKNNTAYWLGKSYLGIGPSAHSYNGVQRSWNIANNIQYIKALQANQLPAEIETLSKRDRYNEYVMTGLRTMWGVSLQKIVEEFGPTYKTYLLKQAEKHLQEHLLYLDNEQLFTSKKGKFLSDGIASDLFLLNLE